MLLLLWTWALIHIDPYLLKFLFLHHRRAFGHVNIATMFWLTLILVGIFIYNFICYVQKWYGKCFTLLFCFIFVCIFKSSCSWSNAWLFDFIVYISLDSLFSSMALKFKGQILIALDYNVIFFLIKVWFNTLSIQPTKAILFGST